MWRMSLMGKAKEPYTFGPANLGPTSVKSFPMDRSVFGVYDLTANEAELTQTLWIPKDFTPDGQIATVAEEQKEKLYPIKGFRRQFSYRDAAVDERLYFDFVAAATRLAKRQPHDMYRKIGIRIGIEPPDLVPQSPPAEVGRKDPELPRSPEPNGGGPGIGRLDFFRQLLGNPVE